MYLISILQAPTNIIPTKKEGDKMRFVLRKVTTLLVTLFLISVCAFLAFQIIPGDPAALQLGVDATPESLEALRVELGLDRPMPIRYGEWMRDLFVGDMGQSYAHGVSVRELLGDRLLVTGSLMAFGFLLTVVVALPIGLLTAERTGEAAYRKGGRIWNPPLRGATATISQVVMAVPPLFLGLILTFVFGSMLRVFTPSDFVSFREDAGAYLLYMLFPALAIALPKAAMTIRLIHSAVRDEMGRDYVRTAISRGDTPRGILVRHMLPNIAVPVVTFLTLTLIMMITDTIVVEQIFSITGAGRLLVSAIGARDYPVVQALVVIIAALVMTLHTITDLICRAIDPRITL